MISVTKLGVPVKQNNEKFEYVHINLSQTKKDTMFTKGYLP